MESQVYLFLFIIYALYINAEANLRILGGRDALKNEFPFAIRLEVKEKGSNKLKHYLRFCTGAAIAPTWILTAAHCYSKEYHENQIKQYARYNSYFPKYRGQLSLLLEFHVHPGYDSRINSDIALFRCEKLSIVSFVKISSIDYTTFVGRETTVLGFGLTNASQLDKPLQVLKGMFSKCDKETEKCRHTLCVAPSCELVATICGGDSGGPVLVSSHVVGVNSQSMDDCDEDTEYMERTPGASASIVAMLSPFIDWIQKVISNKTKPMQNSKLLLLNTE